MSYDSIDKIQKLLAEEVFYYAKDSKKAAGRALGTLVEIITFYLLESWDLIENISIERGLEEYGNPEIKHNVEFSLHPSNIISTINIENINSSISTSKIINELNKNNIYLSDFKAKNNILLTKERIQRNACIIGNSQERILLCKIDEILKANIRLTIYEQHIKQFALIECKRVGIEEGNSKGPQTIEKAKQGAYVARAASSLQKVRTENGEMNGIIYRSDNTYIIKTYNELLADVIDGEDVELLRRFILTIGVVSNHGNWFTSGNLNKELKVLSQSYDWLIFLTDKGLSEFIERLVLNPEKEYVPVKQAFVSSYSSAKKKNVFTKIKMNYEADLLLKRFFIENSNTVSKWFNI